MKKYPIIGVISARHDLGAMLPVFGTTCHYLEQIHEAGGVPLQLPVMPGADVKSLTALADCCDGFLLPGGGDFSPEWYGQSLLTGLKPDPVAIDRESQRTALELVRTMAGSGKPILAICLGMQVLTIALGGELYQDIPTQIPSDIPHAMPMNILEDRWKLLHTVQTADKSLVRSLTGSEELQVNSIHHQAVKTLAPGFSAAAWAPDGVIESIQNDTLNILGVQWHPENLAHAGIQHGKALFHWLIQETAQ